MIYIFVRQFPYTEGKEVIYMYIRETFPYFEGEKIIYIYTYILNIKPNV